MSANPFRFVTLTAAVLVTSPFAAAETLKVKSGLGADLQAAIDAAGPGDTIPVSGGPYVGTFRIPAGKDGL